MSCRKSVVFNMSRVRGHAQRVPPWWYRIYYLIFSLTLPIVDAILNAIFKRLNSKQPKKRLPPIQNDLLLQPATQLAVKIRQKKAKSEDVVRAFIDRLQEVQSILNIYTDERFQEALEEARRVDHFLSTTKKTAEEIEMRKPFLGVPCTVKSSFAVKGLHHDSGYVGRKDVIAEENAATVQFLAEAGFIPVCVTNVPELCRSYESSCLLHGITSNPYDSRRTTGGSSSGEGAALGSAASVVGLGSDLAGSIRLPSAFCGIFGHKTSPDIVDLAGHFPIGLKKPLRPLGVAGPMCRYASDLKPVLKILSAKNVQKLNLDEPVDVKKLRVFAYYFDEIDGSLATRLDDEIRMAVTMAANSVSGKPATKTILPEMNYACGIFRSVLKAERLPPTWKRLQPGSSFLYIVQDLLKWCRGNSKHTLPMLWHGLYDLVEPSADSELYRFLFQEGDRLAERVHDLLGNDGVLICPASPTTAAYHHLTFLRNSSHVAYTGIFNCLFLPVTVCPVGLDRHGLPIAVQVVSNRLNDRLTIAVAAHLERIFGGWTPPSAY